MSVQALTPPSEDFSKWYNEIIYRADLADQSPVRGSIIVKPYGYELWELIKHGMDRRFRATGHSNAYFPLFIPQSFLRREAEHVEGFSPELAVVTYAGGKELEEPYVVRPTSETIIMDAFKNWIQSYRDLPLLLNQWANVVRWELRTRPFLRTTEFLWQEGHTAHATYDEAEAETLQMLDVYADFAVNDAAVPVIKGRKSQNEKFAGALHTYSIEGMMGDMRALQMGTSHNLGQNFARAFDIQFLDRSNERQFVWTTSWGTSWRVLGAVVMAHGDDKGLRLPPRLAPFQAVIVPIFKSDDEKTPVLETAERIFRELTDAGIRVKLDKREDLSPGFKYNDWEMRGVPVRLEIGPKDIEKRSVVAARRDVPGRDGKQFFTMDNLAAQVRTLLDEVQANMLRQAEAFRDANVHEATTYDQFRQIIESGGWVRAWWAGETADELRIKADTQATHRNTPFDQPGGTGVCFLTGREATSQAIFAKAY